MEGEKESDILMEEAIRKTKAREFQRVERVGGKNFI